MATKASISGHKVLGIEGGGTRCVALLVEGNEVQRWEGGPANFRLLSEAQLHRLLRDIHGRFPSPAAVAIGLAGARTPEDRARLRSAVERVWQGIPCVATNDLETGLTAGIGANGAAEPGNQVLVLSGTGACCFGRAADGATIKVDGWGHILGDQASGYDIGLQSLRQVLAHYDKTGEWGLLGQRILRQLQLNEPEQLIAWAQAAAKADIGAVAVEVFGAAAQRDRLAREILRSAASALAQNAVACAKRLQKCAAPTQFVLAGGNLVKQPAFAAEVARQIKRAQAGARVTVLQRESVWGAVELARKEAEGRAPATARNGKTSQALAAKKIAGSIDYRALIPAATAQSPTEQRNPRSMNLDRLSLGQAVKLMVDEDARISPALWEVRQPIERALALIARSLKQGGRLYYVGAGTSGRLGVLDASECPPTFSTPPDLVQGIIAGGQTALWRSIEGAEDDAAAGARAVEFRGVSRRDTVVGIAASGRTPFVWGALLAAKARGAKTVLLCFNPHLKLQPANRPDVVIAPPIGPEILTGSTRLKSGTATKLVLNIFTTLAMVRLGKVAGNLMVDVTPSNVKLRDRAVRIVCELTGQAPEAARGALSQSGWVVKRALKRLGWKN